MSRSGADLALLLLEGFRSLVDQAVAELAEAGFDDVRPAHDFAMRAIDEGAASTSDLARRLSVTKQAAAKTVATLEERGWVERHDDPHDARRKRLRVTDTGHDVLHTGEQIFDGLRRQWARRIGARRLNELEDQLRLLVGEARVRFDSPGWMVREAGETL